MSDPADIADVELVRRCLAGESEAFALLVERHQRVVYGIALRMLGDRDQAEDAAQESFVRAYLALATFKGEHTLRTWLVRIVTRLCIDQLRVRRRRPEVFLEDQRGVQPRVEWEGDITERHAVARAIAELPPHYKAAIILRHLHHLPYAEIARALGIPLATVKTHLRRARALLRARLQVGAAQAKEISQ